MTRYSNRNYTQAMIHFTDGTTQFLYRGQSIITDKKVKKLRGEIDVREVNEGRSSNENQAAKKTTSKKSTSPKTQKNPK